MSVPAARVTGSTPPPTLTRGASPSADNHILGLGAALPDSPSTVNVIGSLLVHATQCRATRVQSNASGGAATGDRVQHGSGNDPCRPHPTTPVSQQGPASPSTGHENFEAPSAIQPAALFVCIAGGVRLRVDRTTRRYLCWKRKPPSRSTGEVRAQVVLAQHLGLGRLEPEFVEEWHSPDQLDV